MYGLGVDSTVRSCAIQGEIFRVKQVRAQLCRELGVIEAKIWSRQQKRENDLQIYATAFVDLLIRCRVASCTEKRKRLVIDAELAVCDRANASFSVDWVKHSICDTNVTNLLPQLMVLVAALAHSG